MIKIPRCEHPNPQFEREDWLNLNGVWQYSFDFGKSGVEREWHKNNDFTEEIIVPYPPESKLSGVEYKDFIPAIWYEKTIHLTQEKLEKEVVLHFGAVDYFSKVFVNGQFVGEHKGGYASFEFIISEYLHEGDNRITVYVEDDINSGRQPKGKQSSSYYSRGCDYTRTTGIWQTVWLEFVPKKRIKEIRYFPNINQKNILIELFLSAKGTLKTEVYFEGKLCGSKKADVNRHDFIQIELSEMHLWEINDGKLYDVIFTFEEDKVNSYFGMREIEMDGYEFKLNGKAVFQKLVLNQGFYENGVYTADSDDVLQRDITLSQEMGFNGARLHEKVFEPRFFYHCDKAGFLIWAEMGNWGIDLSSYRSIIDFLPEWQSIVKRDFNHSSIITWSPFNETWDYDNRQQINEIVELVYHTTKIMDPTRPCIDTSGNYHVITDIYDVHDYAQNIDTLKNHFTGNLHPNGEFWDEHDERQTYTKGQPFCVSEYGGIKWDPEGEGSWGYGDEPKSEAEFMERYEGLTNVLLSHPKIFGYCYTQLYDIEQEKNGLLYYNREPKFNIKKIKEINDGRKNNN